MTVLYSLFGTIYKDDNKMNITGHSYLIGIFKTIEKAEKELLNHKQNMTNNNKYYFFIKEIKLNQVYSYEWSNSFL